MECKTSAATGFFRELEGIRGYAFIVVFFTHYAFPLMKANRRWTFPLRVFVDLAWIAVPVFLVLSGFLITGILLRTREYEGYFRIFYVRRVLRVFPLYFFILAIVGLVGLWAGADLRGYWTNFAYVQNIWPSTLDLMRGVRLHGHLIQLSHFWSLALEEQFYLVWPAVVWLCGTEKKLLTVCLGLLGAFVLFRFFCPMLGYTPVSGYYSSFTRGDAIVLGALLAVWRSGPRYKQLERLALPAVVLGLTLLVVIRVVTGATNPFLGTHTMWRVSYMIPLVNLVALALVVETLRDGSRLQTACRLNVICRLGQLSYGLYAFHLLYAAWFDDMLLPGLERHLSHRPAILLTLSSAFALTLLLAWLSFKLIEQPAMKSKSLFAYGAKRRNATSVLNTSPQPPYGAAMPRHTLADKAESLSYPLRDSAAA